MKKNLKTIQLDSTAQIVISSDSKGNQIKWIKRNQWYKADGLGYEALAEYAVSKLLKYTNITHYINYDLVKLQHQGHLYTGCVSQNFLKRNEELVTIEKLIDIQKGFSITEKTATMHNTKEKIKYVVELVENITGLNNFGAYLTAMLEIDALFLNNDRHFNNISVIMDDKHHFQLSPLYDFGSSLFSDLLDEFPIDKNIELCYKHMMSKPFSEDFDEQVFAAEELYGQQLWYCFDGKNIEDIFNQAKDYYSNEIIQRAQTVVGFQKHKFAYLEADLDKRIEILEQKSRKNTEKKIKIKNINGPTK